MKVMNVKTKAVNDYNSAYAKRLIEQGKAVPVKGQPAQIAAAQEQPDTTEQATSKKTTAKTSASK